MGFSTVNFMFFLLLGAILTRQVESLNYCYSGNPGTCQNGGYCVQDDIYLYHCQCPLCYIGDYCEVKQSGCSEESQTTRASTETTRNPTVPPITKQVTTEKTTVELQTTERQTFTQTSPQAGFTTIVDGATSKSTATTTRTTGGNKISDGGSQSNLIEILAYSFIGLGILLVVGFVLVCVMVYKFKTLKRDVNNKAVLPGQNGSSRSYVVNLDHQISANQPAQPDVRNYDYASLHGHPPNPNNTSQQPDVRNYDYASLQDHLANSNITAPYQIVYQNTSTGGRTSSNEILATTTTTTTTITTTTSARGRLHILCCQ
ncbi:uncharacterized protein LOC144435305 [Glandiceps talaboti]